MDEQTRLRNESLNKTLPPKCHWAGDLPQPGTESKCDHCQRMVSKAGVLRCRMSGPRVQGLGDVIAKVTHATGINRVVKAVTGGGCGCDKRQSTLNRILPIGPVIPEDPTI